MFPVATSVNSVQYGIDTDSHRPLGVAGKPIDLSFPMPKGRPFFSYAIHLDKIRVGSFKKSCKERRDQKEKKASHNIYTARS